MAKERNPNIEIWWCFCMFAVVLGHVLYNNDLARMAGFQWHIPGFLLISGYFGIRFTFKKVFKLIFIAYACYWLTIPLHPESNGLISLLLPHGGWFLPFYCVLMILSPLLNAALKDEKCRKTILASVLVLVAFGWIPTLVDNPHVGMLAIPGMQGSGLLLMIATYVIGATLHTYSVCEKLRVEIWLAGFVIGILLCVLMGFLQPKACHYLSPIAIATASCGLMCFMSLRQLPAPVGRAVNFIAPSMFSVYLLHECCIKRYQYCVGGVPTAIARSLLLFFGCIAIDMIRRFIEHSICKLRGHLKEKFA